ncbi:hypothetical protein L228DRAFT_279302 [Xylona heveae TC161]|uniref:Uncharacterized protein n=1 Tax=Xylona heveae (strain CBS 132557 / TC161) TaxID=1328760 RepID=A0A165JCI7_XYLHT|nr:hypothetical protein L228DRAFT_279302 [Xylona heveae TC161]KZF26054.1 hypothetical protein L228DRAFT_279302 [Xylona heveae TC161]
MEPRPHGVKRQADSTPDNDQRLAKRFELLDIEQNGKKKLYVPVQSPSSAYTPKHSSPSSDSMQLDDTKDRIYIHNLDEELAEVDSDDDKVIFLPDIERRLTKIPKSVLRSQNPPPIGNNELVLYSVPESLSVPAEHDSVRRAIIEARQRIREKQVQEQNETARGGMPIGHDDQERSKAETYMQTSQHTPETIPLDNDGDAMELE